MQTKTLSEALGLGEFEPPPRDKTKTKTTMKEIEKLYRAKVRLEFTEKLLAILYKLRDEDADLQTQIRLQEKDKALYQKRFDEAKKLI